MGFKLNRNMVCKRYSEDMVGRSESDSPAGRGL